VLAHAAATLALVLLAGAGQPGDWPGFVQAVEAYELLPAALLHPLAALLAWPSCWPAPCCRRPPAGRWARCWRWPC
jgi:hypothetical protein